MRKTFLSIAVAAAAIVAVAGPARAITNGELDGGGHPYVGLMIATNATGTPMWRCSGALISPKVFVTAGHCTSGADGALVWFETDLEVDPDRFGYPDNKIDDHDSDGNPITKSGTAVAGTTWTHPKYDDAAFYLYDLGVVVLEEAVELDGYAVLAPQGVVDDFTIGRTNGSTVDAVGYGLQELVEGPVGPFDPKLQSDKTRYQAELAVISVKGAGGVGSKANKAPDSGSFLASGDPTTGGTCPGDSGGPILLPGTGEIVGVTSFGFNPNCSGPGGVYRIDRAADHQFIRSFLG